MILSIGVVFLLLFLLFLWGWISSGMILGGLREPITSNPGTFGLPYSDEVFRSEDGVEIRAWFVPAPVPSDVTVVVVHGWGANRSGMLEQSYGWAARGGYNLFYFDFRNHGESGNGRSSLSRHEIGDLTAALAHVRRNHPAESRRMGLYGMSMGGAICLWVAAHDPSILGVAAESSFCSFNDTVSLHGRLFYGVPRFPFSDITLWFTRRRLGFDPEAYSPLDVVGKIAPRPLFILQGGNDIRIPPTVGEQLFAAAGEPKSLWTVPVATHATVAETGGEPFQERVLAFFGGVFKAPLP